MKKRLFLIALIWCGIMTVPRLCATDLESVIVPLFSEVEKTLPHGLWMNGINDAEFERIEQDNRFVMILNGQQGVVGFNGHTPLNLSGLPQNASITIRFRSKQENQPNKIMFSWRFDNQKRSSVAARQIKDSTSWQTVTLALPSSGDGETEAKGYWITFEREGRYEIAEIAVTEKSKLNFDPVPAKALFDSDVLTISGRAATEVQSVTARIGTTPLAEAAVHDGTFSLKIPKKKLPVAEFCSITLDAVAGKVIDSRELPKLFIYPTLKQTRLEPVSVKNGKLYRAERPFAFTGTNYTDFQLGLSIRPDMDYHSIASAVKRMADWKMSVIRLPLNVGLVQPAEGVFPDDPRWKEELRKHGLKEYYFDYIDYLIALAGDYGLYVVLDFHGFPVDPYRYFLGGQPSDRAKGKPGTAISWLENDKKSNRMFPEFRNGREVKALEESFRWLARHWKGNTNLLGFEVPYNEPHDAFMSIPKNFNRITGKIIGIIHAEDPERLVFSMPAAWGHDNVSWSATWLPPAGIAGGAPHFYVANGPIPLRPDAQESPQPWLCRDVEETFACALPAILLPYSGLDYPVYNGEGGEHGHGSFLPGMKPDEAADYMIENTLVQCYAAGLSGALQWTLWSEAKSFRPYEKIYEKQYTRFGDVYRAGPVDWSNAEVALIQNVAAVPIQNGYNHACVPFARLMLDLHLNGNVRYWSDDQIIYSGLTNVSEGLEQVSEARLENACKAIIVDSRNLDDRVRTALKALDTPVLWTDDPATLEAEKVAEFLAEAGVRLNRKSPPEIQLIEGPGHLIAYRRMGEGNGSRIYPLLKRSGNFILTDENGRVVFRGNADTLYRQGIELTLPKWRSVILTITKENS